MMQKQLDISFIDSFVEGLLKAEEQEREDEAMAFRGIVTYWERRFKSDLRAIFSRQRKEVQRKVATLKDMTDLFMFDIHIWEITTQLVAEKYMTRVLQSNGKRVFDDLMLIGKKFKDILVGITYDMDYPEALEYIDSNSILLAKEITATTEAAVKAALSQGFIEGLAAVEIARNIDKVFDHADDVRASLIARTEMARAANYGAIMSYKQSTVVEGKEWLTAQDERVCPFCVSMDTDVQSLNDNFLSKWASLTVTNEAGKEVTMQNTYLDVEAPPLHPGCRCTVLPVMREFVTSPKLPVEKPARLDAVQKQFHDPEDGLQYMTEKKKYKAWMKAQGVTAKSGHLDEKFLNDYFREDFPNSLFAMEKWQGDTNTAQAMSFRLRSTLLEGNSKKLIWKESYIKEQVFDKLDDAENLRHFVTKDEYIKFRAFNQAYMEAKKIKKVTLYRGTDGRTGEAIIDNISNGALSRKSFWIDDRQLSGYSLSEEIADNFGSGSGGLTMRVDFKRADIIVHKDLMTGATGTYREELEYICKSKKRKIKVVDMRFEEKGWDQSLQEMMDDY